MINPDNFPVMKGSARMALGAGDFEVPLFSNIEDNLWMGCSPAEFPDELEPFEYNLNGYEAYKLVGNIAGKPINCHWLYTDSLDQDTMEEGPPVPRFDYIFNLFEWGEYAVPNLTKQVTHTMFDGYDVDGQQVDNIARNVITALENGMQVLVHCQAGLNRSSLVVARVLMIWRGMTADQAIGHIRDKRSPMCLCNETFQKYLREL